MVKLASQISDTGKLALTNILEALAFFMALSSMPIRRKLLLIQFGHDYGNNNVNTSVYRLCKKGFIFQFKQKNNIFFKVLLSKRYDIIGDFVTLKIDNTKQKWDGKWRLLIYDIPEKRRGEREYLRKLLQLLGFGKIQDSCWVSAYDYSELIYDCCKKRGLEKCICLYEGSFFAGKNIDKLVGEAWKLKEIKQNYNTIIADCTDLIKDILSQKRQAKEIYNDYTHVYNLFKETVRKDPFLPEQFLMEWPYKKVEESLKQLSLAAFKKENKIF